MQESYFTKGQIHSYLRHSSLIPNRKTLLFLHGLGDSSLSFIPFLHAQTLKEYNIIIPDFLGYGKSSRHQTYDFQSQVNTVVDHVLFLENQLGFSLASIILLPHSIASIEALLLCESVIKPKIKGIIVTEGSITQYGSFISEQATRTASEDRFDTWFDEFKENTIFEQFIRRFPVCRSYYASLRFCDPKVFLQNALETQEICKASSGKYTNSAGKEYIALKLPKIYCYGDKSLCKESIDFLHENDLATKVFRTDNHFVMLECLDEFIIFLDEWVTKNI